MLARKFSEKIASSDGVGVSLPVVSTAEAGTDLRPCSKLAGCDLRCCLSGIDLREGLRAVSMLCLGVLKSGICELIGVVNLL